MLVYFVPTQYLIALFVHKLDQHVLLVRVQGQLLVINALVGQEITIITMCALHAQQQLPIALPAQEIIHQHATHVKVQLLWYQMYAPVLLDIFTTTMCVFYAQQLLRNALLAQLVELLA
jgi:hypothetical protein